MGRTLSGMNNLYAVQWQEETCPQCGTVFIPSSRSEWTYKGRFGKDKRKQYFCSYHCFTEAMKNKANRSEHKPAGRICKLSEADLDVMHGMLKSGYSLSDCARYFAVNLNTIQRYLSKRREQFRDVWNYMGWD